MVFVLPLSISCASARRSLSGPFSLAPITRVECFPLSSSVRLGLPSPGALSAFSDSIDRSPYLIPLSLPPLASRTDARSPSTSRAAFAETALHSRVSCRCVAHLNTWWSLASGIYSSLRMSGRAVAFAVCLVCSTRVHDSCLASGHAVAQGTHHHACTHAQHTALRIPHHPIEREMTVALTKRTRASDSSLPGHAIGSPHPYSSSRPRPFVVSVLELPSPRAVV